MKKSILILVSIFALVSCGDNKTANGENGNLEVTVTMKGNDPYCYIYLETKNNTKYNFNDLALEYATRDKAENIIATESVSGRVTPNGTGILKGMPASHCSDIGSIEITGFYWTASVDSENIRKREDVSSLPIYSQSKIPNVTVKSGAGPIKNNENTSSQAEIKKASADEKIYKFDDFELASSYMSDPFSIRNKLIGKNVELKIFVDKFKDEGTKARLIADGSGVTCLMDGSEFSKHNDRSVKIVRGKLAEWSGGLSLDNCIYVGEGEGWEPTDKVSNVK